MLKLMNIILALNLLRNTFENKTTTLISRLQVLNKLPKDQIRIHKKATGTDKIPVKIVKLAASVIDSHLTNIINNDLSNKALSNSAKLASV